jgi:hypothetical protein
MAMGESLGEFSAWRRLKVSRRVAAVFFSSSDTLKSSADSKEASCGKRI